MNKQWFIYFILILCVIAWGSNFVFGSILVDVFDPSIIAFIRLIFILIFLFFMTFRNIKNQKLNFHDYIWLAVAGFVGISLNQWSFYASLQYTEPVTAALILALSPIVTALLSSYYFNERKKLQFWIGSFVALIGVWLVITKGSFLVPNFGKGELLITLTMLSFSVFLVFVQHLSKTIHPSSITWYSNVFGLIGILPFVPWHKTNIIFSVPFSYWLLLIITAIIMHGLCTYLWNNSIHKVGATKAALLLNLEPFVAMVFGLLLLGMSIQLLQLIGAFVIVIGVSISLQTKNKT
ncbi:Permease of the drug/metabolite transporter (DMT) superfamily [Psychrobacillus sp. OK028]|uniref:DMT family transporter n=1 Tax=Psychrobacillus sp. OK028 TaxID=1884359 RepID=UPI00088F77A4|nr:DMT family transporter [Psychrobacillus sp. OK028]SDN60140.1 Permease of the drug/metabolite transporter (DMT) superfamily [Psychrobacillus sp. OK028]